MSRRLFVPGTGGCFYESDGGERDASILSLALDRQQEFLCQHSAEPDVLEPLSTSGKLRNGEPVNVRAAGVIRAVYNSFFSQQDAAASLERKYDFFNYDWRLDIRHSGNQLWQYLKSSGANDPWDLVCHSQGGLLVLWASIGKDPAEFGKYVRRVIFLGVPMQGTLNSAEALVSGVGLMPGVAADVATVRTWPSVYMMLPRWRLGMREVSGVELFKSSGWRTAGLLSGSGSPADGVLPELLSRAQSWKRALDNESFPALQEIDRLILVEGVNHNTLLLAPEFPLFPNVAAAQGAEVVSGDGLVPADRTIELLPPGLQRKVELITKDVTSHMLMCNSTDIATLCHGLLEAS